jgi:hypothetical protein
MKLRPYHWSPRCGAKTRAGTPCRKGAMPNGKCRNHGGASLAGRHHGRFRHGRRSKAADAARAAAKMMRLKAEAAYREDVLLGFGPAFALKRLNKKLDEAHKVEWSWLDRYYPRDPRGQIIWHRTRRPPIRARRPEFPGGYPGTLGGGRFTRRAKAERQAQREAAAQLAFQRAVARMEKIEARTERRLCKAGLKKPE